MYEVNPRITCSCDDSTKIWRYLDFTKFVSLIETSSLFFCRSDKLRDPFEGSLPLVNVKLRQEEPKPKNGYVDIFKPYSEMIGREIRKFIHLNCWHINEYESEAMWNIFLKSDEGVAIQSTVGKLKRSFHMSQTPVFVGDVKYILIIIITKLLLVTLLILIFTKENLLSMSKNSEQCVFLPGIKMNLSIWMKMCQK